MHYINMMQLVVWLLN